ncbi:ATP-dependent helicase [Nymphaea thermarum]|nr:ATP-dependent helicase [Nymphaea thermarum]
MLVLRNRILTTGETYGRESKRFWIIVGKIVQGIGREVMDGPELKVNVRTLDGRSMTVAVANGQTVKNLRDILKESLAPAGDYQNFHLFLKGQKLNLEDKLEHALIRSEDFIVLMPYRKKKQSLTDVSTWQSYPSHETGGNDTHPGCSTKTRTDLKWSSSSASSSAAEGRSTNMICNSKPEDTQIRSFTEAAWSDIVSDLSSVSEIMRDSSNVDIPLKKKGSSTRVSLRNEDLLRFFGLVDANSSRRSNHSSSNDLGSCVSEAVDIPCPLSPWCAIKDKCYEQFYQIIESVNCLSDLQTGSCLLFQEFGKASFMATNLSKVDGIACSDERSQCICPSWLKKVLKVFTFLNIIYAYLQISNMKVAWSSVEELLRSVKIFDTELITVSDIEDLSVLCPKTVQLNAREGHMDESDIPINIVDPDIMVMDSLGMRIAKKQIFGQAIVDIIMNRQHNFEKEIWRIVKDFWVSKASITGSSHSLTLDDVLIFVKEGNNVTMKTKKLKRTRESKTPTRNSQCKDRHQMLPEKMLEHLREGIGSHEQIVHVEYIRSRTAMHVEIPNNLLSTTRAALRKMGISRLYSHQEESIRYSLSGKNVVVSTSTASGKSLCYNVPVLEALSQDLTSCAIYIFPTKNLHVMVWNVQALAQDQLRVLLEITGYAEVGLDIGVYDGDTSQADRSWSHANARLLITNPDMLHKSILPFHFQFQRILSNLRFVVIDEAHAYKGAFGCHTALIVRRLRRLCCHVYGSDPSFVLCTATSANPREHAMELTGLGSLDLVQNDGSPSGPKLFVLWNPPLRSMNGSSRLHGPKLQTSLPESVSANEDNMAKRSSPIMETALIFTEMVQHGLRCIAFCKTRKLSEIVLCYALEILRKTAPDLVNYVCAYRAGYIAEERRKIEMDFFGGKLLGVTATNALELGIDVGHIDATLHLGFPGSVASLWQQAGRSGRRENASLSIYIAFEGPLDQYFMKFPQKLFGRSIENCQIDVHNKQILEQHITCAAFEHPLSLQHDAEYFGSRLEDTITTLRTKGNLGHESCNTSLRTWVYVGREKIPSHAIGIRSTENDKYQVIDETTSAVIEEIEESKAFFQVYEGAVYMQQGKSYLVTVIDLSAKIAICRKVDLKYYTKTRDYTDIHVFGGEYVSLNLELAYPAKMTGMNYQRTTARVTACKVTTKWFGFYKIWRRTNKIFDKVDLFLPEYSYESQAVWIRVPEPTKIKVEAQNLPLRTGLHAASHAILNLVPLYIMSNSSDLGTECANPHESRYFPARLLLYDQQPGGVGISAQNFSCPEYNEVLSKTAAILVLEIGRRSIEAA